MQFSSNLLIAGITVLLAAGCSSRGKCYKSRFDRNADCCQSCAGSLQPVGPQNLRTRIAALTAFSDSQVDQVASVIAIERPPFEFVTSRPSFATSESSSSVDKKPDYIIEEVVPYQNSQMQIAPVEPSLSQKKSSRLAYHTGEDFTSNDRPVTQDPNTAGGIDSKEENENPLTTPPVSDSTNNLVVELDPFAPPTDKLTAPSTSILVASSATSSRLQESTSANEEIDMLWMEEVSTSTEGRVTVADSVGNRVPKMASPIDRAVVVKVEKQIVLRARPQYHETFIDSITRNSSLPSKPVQRSKPIEPARQSTAKIEVTSIEQPSDPPTTKLHDSQPNHASSMPNMVPISKLKLATQSSNSGASMSSVPMLQASSKKTMNSLTRTGSAARVLNQNTTAYSLLNSPKKILRLRATTGLSSDQRFPPIIRLNTGELSNNQARETNQLKHGEFNQARLLPPNIDATNMPSYNNAPMIDHSRVNESIRRLTVRPAVENQPAENTIDR